MTLRPRPPWRFDPWNPSETLTPMRSQLHLLMKVLKVSHEGSLIYFYEGSHRLRIEKRGFAMSETVTLGDQQVLGEVFNLRGTNFFWPVGEVDGCANFVAQRLGVERLADQPHDSLGRAVSRQPSAGVLDEHRRRLPT